MILHRRYRILVLLAVLGAAAPVLSQQTGPQDEEAEEQPDQTPEPPSPEELARKPPRPLSSALHAAGRGDWARAQMLALRDGPVAAEIIEWTRLRSGAGSLEQVLAFLKAHPDWPGLDYLRRRHEDQLQGAGPDQILAFFGDTAAQTGTGVLLRAAALTANGQQGEAEASLVLAWRSMSLTQEEHNAFLTTHADLLKPHHEARLDRALWQGWSADANRMVPLVSEARWKLALARRGLKDDAGNVDTLIDALPEALQQDAGLAFERFDWRVRKGREEEAIALMLERSAIPGGLGLAESWAPRRRYYVREKIYEGDFGLAYRLAAQNQLTGGAAFADLEFLAGFIALRWLDDPERALMHFERLRDGVETPISLGRAWYWIGRAEEAMGRSAEAMAAYTEGGGYQTTYYGLLSAEKAGLPPDPDLAGDEDFGDWHEADFAGSDQIEAGMLLLAAGQGYDGERFLVNLADHLDRTGLGRLGRLLEEEGSPHLQIMLGKAAAQRDIVLPRFYYALHPLAAMEMPVPPEMALAIARRESEFDPSVSSHAGAQGLMQLMPATARLVARGFDTPHDAAAVLSDWTYNTRLGTAYLADLADRFDGNVLLVAAGYNAGPGRPEQWINDFGDPRDGDVDVVDWVELIPYRETRNYVMRVAESLPVYRARLGKAPLPQPFTKELKGSSLLLGPPFAPKGE